MRNWRSAGKPLLLLVALSVSVGACGSDDDANGDGSSSEDRCAGTKVDTYVAGLQKTGKQNKYQIQLQDADPAPPARGDNKWTLKVVDMSGKAVEGATVTVTPTMPTHGHGTTPPKPTGEPATESGTYEVSPVNLFMPGPWKSVIEVEADGVKDSAEFWFCIEP